ncbi:MAG TPA: ATP-dependent sacrificial sulfur transferase LarE [Thermoplasmata archaeon]|nr:ATP-dependent sacrificial sulfur transferase LarE [Thermoplasmata archaeon]
MIRSPSGSIAPVPRTPEEVVRHIASGGRTVVALSGGVDSASVAALTHRALGDGALAVVLTGPALPPGELDRALAVGATVGISVTTVPIDPVAEPRYAANPSNRCYFCRTVEAAALVRFGREHGAVQYVDGVHVDDLSDDRPGLRALDEAGFSHPLLWGGWRKRDVRAFARSIDLPNAEIPSESCLASRIPHGEPVTAPLLERIRGAEEWLHTQGFQRVRVRVTGASARVEVDASEVDDLLRPMMAQRVLAELTRLGFESVQLDPGGYRVRAGG